MAQKDVEPHSLIFVRICLCCDVCARAVVMMQPSWLRRTRVEYNRLSAGLLTRRGLERETSLRYDPLCCSARRTGNARWFANASRLDVFRRYYLSFLTALPMLAATLVDPAADVEATPLVLIRNRPCRPCATCELGEVR